MADYSFGDLNPTPQRHAFEMGLASALIGAVLIVTAPLMILIGMLMAAFGPRALGMNTNDISWARLGLLVGEGLLLLLGLIGLFFGLGGLTTARTRNQPAGLSVAGVLICLVGIAVFIFATINTVAVLEWYRRDPYR